MKSDVCYKIVSASWSYSLFFLWSTLCHMIVIWEAVRFRLQSGFHITPFPWISESAILKSEFLYTEALKVKAEGPHCVSLLLFFTPTIKSFNSKGGGEECKILRQSLGGKIKLILKVKNSTLNFISEQCSRQSGVLPALLSDSCPEPW